MKEYDKVIDIFTKLKDFSADNYMYWYRFSCVYLKF